MVPTLPGDVALQVGGQVGGKDCPPVWRETNVCGVIENSGVLSLNGEY